MKLIVFGATGSIGRELVRAALQQGNIVTAFTRNPSALESLKHLSLSICKGDLVKVNEVKNAIKGHDAVLCAIGDGSKGQIRAIGTKNIIEAMQAVGVERFICQTTLGLGDSRNNLNFFWKHIMFGMLLKKAYRDHEVQEAHIFKSNLDWTIVRPGAFTNEKPTGTYRMGFDGGEKNLKLKISRADVADFMLNQTSSNQFVRQTVSISN